MKKIRENSAGIDIGASHIFVSVAGKEVRIFETFTADIEQCAIYLLENKIETVAMEATGVYWVMLYDILENHELDVWLVDGRSTKQVPGRKTDIKDCQWIQQLHSYGLLNRCFIAPDSIQELRSYQRLREDHIQSASSYINQMQKSLILMNIRLTEVLSQVHGVSGMRIIRAILEGERDVEVLTSMCDVKILKTKEELVKKALNGYYSAAGLFSLGQAVDCYDFYQKKISLCDKQIEQVLKRMVKGKKLKVSPLPKNRKKIRHNKPEIKDMGIHLMKIFNEKDATVLPGITDYNWLQLLSELGTDLNKWKTDKHFTSWLCLAPRQHNSGKMKRNHKTKGGPKAGLIFKQAAASILNSKNIALGVFGRKIRSKKGGLVAIKAVARKLAALYWKLQVKGLDYIEKGIAKYEEQILLNKQKNLERLAKELGVVVS